LPVLALTFAMGCAVPLTEGGRRVTLNKEDPPSGCTEIGSLKGDGTGIDLENSKNLLRNRAAERGANYVRFEVVLFEESVAAGTAYRCPNLQL
jgi:hypothetical protein